MKLYIHAIIAPTAMAPRHEAVVAPICTDAETLIA